MPRRLTEEERQVRVLQMLPENGEPIRVSQLCKKLRMGVKRVDGHLERLEEMNMVEVAYLPGKRAPMRMVWLTAPFTNIVATVEPNPIKKPTPSTRRKIKNKVLELLE